MRASILLPAFFLFHFLYPVVARTQEQEKAPLPTRTIEEKVRSSDESNIQSLLRRVQKLEKHLSEIQNSREEEELEKLRQSADTEAATAEDEPKSLEERTYITASRSLQALNPEISVSGDFLAQVIANQDFYAAWDDRSGLPLRAMDVHIQSTLDPFSFTKMSLGMAPPDDFLLEELYITWTGIIPRTTLTVGRFRHQFGVLNRWHQHDLDQTHYPVAICELFGCPADGRQGLSGNGVALGWLMPSLWAHTNELTIQITDGENENLFAGDAFSVPTAMVHMKNYYDLTESTYLELGLSGMFGFNNKRGFKDPSGSDQLLTDNDWRQTWVAGADLTLFWSPTQQARYRSFTWRSECFWINKETEEGTLQGWGAYSYLQYQMGASWFVGLRGDIVDPLFDGDDRLLWQVVPYITFWQSEFVFLRLEGRHGEVSASGHDTRVLFQVNFAAGPHKHEKY